MQQDMLRIAMLMLKESGLLPYAALGGGTALAGKYWNHRFSTDIDIFIYKNSIGDKSLLTHHNWSKKVEEEMKKIGYSGDMKFQNIYLEFTITDESKIQFFDTKNFTQNPYTTTKLWGFENTNIESIEEIIAKKIHYRADNGNSRDLFDIAMALQSDPLVFLKLTCMKTEKFYTLYETVDKISKSEVLKQNFLDDIAELNPNENYKKLAYFTIGYLKLYLENYIGYINLGMEISNNDMKLLSKLALEEVEKGVRGYM
jgi:hypothetical protein